MYRAGIEWILGFRLAGRFAAPRPRASPPPGRGFEIISNYRSARYDITVENPQRVSRGVASATLDGNTLPTSPARVPLVDDGKGHKVHVILG